MPFHGIPAEASQGSRLKVNKGFRHGAWNPRAADRVALAASQRMEAAMKGIFAWLIGIPIPIIILLYFFDVF